jgi:hypothetical protein
MAQMPLDSRETVRAAWGAAASAGRVPAPFGGAAAWPVAPRANAETPTGWRRRLVRVVRDVAIGMALMALVPIGIVGMRHSSFTPNFASTTERVRELDRVRALGVPVDASVSPQQAGDALLRVVASEGDQRQLLKAGVRPHVRPWTRGPLPPNVFPDAQSPQYRTPRPDMVIAFVTSGRVTATDLAYLKGIAELPLWRDFDLVARARSVDVLGGLFETPFDGEVALWQISGAGFSNSKQLASAAVSRAAYYAAIGNTTEAERVLRSIVSYGLHLVDDGESTFDALIGRAVIDIGRDGLWHLYTATGRGELAAVAEPFPSRVPKAGAKAASAPPAERPWPDVRKSLLATLADSRAPRAVRMEALRVLSYSGCRDARSMVLGPDDDIAAAFTSARASLARYPSEQAYFDLAERTLEEGPVQPGQRDHRTLGPLRVLTGASSVVSVVTGNPRFESCTRMWTGWY